MNQAAMSVYHTAPRIELASMSQLAEAVNKEDDWTGVTDAASRRKRQNRLNVRAYRRRKLLESKSRPKSEIPLHTDLVKPEPVVPCWIEDQQTIANVPAFIANKFINSKRPLIPYNPSSPSAVKIIFPLSPDHLIPLLQYNVLRASITNRTLLNAGLPPTPTDECTTAALSVLPFPLTPSSLPATLHPTHLQRTIPHESWIDIVPLPSWRDDLILATIGPNPKLDEEAQDALWSDIMGGLFEGFPAEEIEKRGMLVWGSPWDISGWEVTAGWWKRWGWCASGCETEVLAATDWWRSARGEEPLSRELDECRLEPDG